MLLAVFRSILDLPKLERRFALVLFATLGTALLPLTWEDQKAAWFVLAILVGLTVYKGLPRPGAAPLQARAVPLARRTAGPPTMSGARVLPPGADGSPSP
jgi:hypothetical protein